MLRISDVTDERTHGRTSEKEPEQDHPQLPLESAPQEESPIYTDVQTAPAQSIPANLVTKSSFLEKTHIRSQLPVRAKRRMSVSKRIAELFTHDLPLLRSPKSIRAMTWKARINFYLSDPEESHIGWRLQQFVMLILFVNVGIMASETVDGPRFGSSDPDFPYLLSENSYNVIEAFFSLLYVVEFALRWFTAPRQEEFWKSKSTWIYFLAAVAAVAKFLALMMGTATREAETIMFNLRILRAVRLILASYAFVGTKVLFRAVADAIAPLTITLFFLITVVMVFATAIFYAEPCYDLQVCTFTDIFNTGYFVMLTVATVGYGSQVPAIQNAGSLLLVCMVMIFGTVYFSMPLAIIGIKYELAWTDYDEFAKTLKQGQRSIQIQPLFKLSTNTSRRQLLTDPIEANSQLDETLTKTDAHTVKYASSVTCDQFYKLSQGILDVHFTLQSLNSFKENTSSYSMTLENVIQSTKRRSDETSQALDNVMSVIKLHSRVCADAHELLQASLTSSERGSDLNRFISSGKLASKDLRGSQSASRMSRAKGAIAAIGSKAMKVITHHDHHMDPNSLRARIWHIFEYRQDVWQARVVNKIRLYSVVLNIVIFYLQTTPELQKTGLQTVLCLRNVHDYCARYNEPGCYIFREVLSSGSEISVEMTDQRLDLHCGIDDSDNETCYGSGVNFASNRNPLSCSDMFPSSFGIEYICKNRLCNPPVQFLFDMEPYWIYFEFLFGFLFTMEVVLHVYAHPVRRHLWGDVKVMANLAILLPFYVEIGEILAGEWPTYSVVPSMPSFFTAVRILKSLRILKLGTHIPGARVLLRTAQLVTERLAIPLFFLFLGCVVSAAIFFEIERGTECFVGTKCMWWHKNVLTHELAEDLPTGKRLLVQNTTLTIITDMLRSTWFSLVSFTTVGYGDLHPRTSLGKLVDIVVMIFSSCYTAMPLTLVGGQFYICYELHAQEERLKDERTQTKINSGKLRTQPMLQSMRSFARRMDGAVNTRATSHLGLHEIDPTKTASQAAIEPVEAVNTIRVLSVRSSSSSASSTARDEEATTAPHYSRSTEVQIINHFFLIQQVFHEIIKDISFLNRLGIERVNIMRKHASEAPALLADVRRREEAIEMKMSENMEFCVTACLSFAAMIERICGSQRAHKPQPSFVHTNALLAVADVTNELLQANGGSSARSGHSRRSVDQVTALAQMPILQSKRTLKKMATLSKVFVGPILQQRSGKANVKRAEFNKQNHQPNSQPE